MVKSRIAAGALCRPPLPRRPNSASVLGRVTAQNFVYDESGRWRAERLHVRGHAAQVYISLP